MLMTIMHRLEKWIVGLNQFTHKISMLAVFTVMLLTFGDVAGRYFVAPIKGAYELTEIGLIVMVFFSLGYTQRMRGHIAIGLLVDRFPPKIQALTDALMYLLSAVLILFMSWQLWVYAGSLRDSNSVTGDLSIPVFTFVWIAVFGSLQFALMFLVDFIKSLQRVVKRHES